jgi:cytoskeleton protein RodZ
MADSEQPAAETAASASPNLGQILRDARVAKDLTIEQIATELRIEARQLAALEDNRFEQIGVPVFVKGYVRQYAQRLGLDQRSLMEMYGRQAKLEEVQIQPSKTIKLRDERQITVWVVSVLVLLLIAVGLAVWWMNGGNFELGIPAQSVPVAAPRIEPAAAPAPVEAAPASAESAPPPRPEAVPVPEAAAPAPEAAASAEPAPPPARVARGATPLALDVTFDAESWAEINDARGERLFVGLGAPGKHLSLRGEPPIAVTFGNADGVRLLVDGERYQIPTQGRQGKLVRFSIASDEE